MLRSCMRATQRPPTETCALAAEHGVTAKAYRCDVSDFDATKETVAQILADFGDIPNILVNNAGITRDGLLLFHRRRPTLTLVIDTNWKGAFQNDQALLFAFHEAPQRKDHQHLPPSQG